MLSPRTTLRSQPNMWLLQIPRVDQSRKLAVYDRPLDTGDVALLQQVASIVPLAALPDGARKVLSHARPG